MEADGAVDAQNAPTVPWKTLCVFHELPQGLSNQITHEKPRKAPKWRWETRIDPHKVLDGVEPDRPQAHGVLDGAADVVETKVLKEPQHLHVLTRARLAQPCLQQAPQPEELVRQLPPRQRRRLIERAGLALQQSQVVSRLEDQRFPLVAATMAGNLVTAAHDHDLVHVAFHYHRPVAVGGRHRIVIAAVAHQRQRRDPRRALVAAASHRRSVV